MSNTVANICKGASIILFIFGFIGSIAMGNSAIATQFGGGFNFLIFFYCIVSCFIFCLFLYALGEIIDLLQNSNAHTYEIYRFIQKNFSKDNENQAEEIKAKLPPVSKIKRTINGDWICKKCSRENTLNVVFCKDCGEYR